MSSELLATIPVEMEPKFVAVACDGTRAYVTMRTLSDPSRGAVAVIDTAKNTVTATIPIARFPTGVVVAPDGAHAYVSNLLPAGGVVSVIDTAANAVVDNIIVSPPTAAALGVAMTPDGCQLYVVTMVGVGPDDVGKGAVKIIDANSKAIIATIPMSPCELESFVGITPDGRFAYALDIIGFPAVIDTTTHAVTSPIEIDRGCGRMAFTPNGLLAYAVSDTVDSLGVYDLANHKLLTLIDVFGGGSTDVAVTPNGRHAYVTQRPASLGGRVLVIDTATQKLVDPPIEMPNFGSADGLAFTPNGQTAYVSDRNSRAVHVVAVRP